MILSSFDTYQYGVYQLFITSYSLLSSFSGIGAGVLINDVVRYVGDKKEAFAKKLYWEQTLYRATTGVLLWAITFFGASLFSFRFGPEFIGIIKLFSFLFLHDVAFEAMRLVIKVRMQFWAIAVRPFIAKTSQLLILLFFFFTANIGIREFVLAQVLSSFVALLFLVPVFIKAYQPWREIAAARERIMLRIFRTYGKWGLLRPLTGRLSSSAYPFIIKLMLSTEALGVFAIANTMISMVKDFLPSKSLGTLVPLAGSNKERQQRIFNYGTKYLVLISLVLTGGALIVFPPVISRFFPQHVGSISLFYIMLPNIPLLAAGGLIGIYLTVFRKQKFLFFKGLATDGIKLLSYVILIPLVGIWGLAIERVTTPLLILPAMYYLYIRRSRLGVMFEWDKMLSFGKEDKNFLRDLFREALVFGKRFLRLSSKKKNL